mmetsp:Transcript_9029/g.37233  ORF Transcript_9029/g.37233 Transcript_9029/m.37233 type:complete len:279 (-) Transcript_9029:836-1672(-)
MDRVEECPEVVEAHEESTVVVELIVAKVRHQVRGPLGRSVTPRASPLVVAPGVPHADQAVAAHLLGVDDAVGMVQQESVAVLLLGHCHKRTHFAAHEEALRDVRHEHVPLLIRRRAAGERLGLIQPQLFHGLARKVAETVGDGAAVQGTVAAVELGVGLLEDRDPELVVVLAGSECRPTVRAARQAVVHLDADPLAVFEEAADVVTSLEVGGEERLLDEARAARRNDRERAQEPTVAKRSLDDVSLVHAVHEELRVGSNLDRPPPARHLAGVLAEDAA